MTDTTYVQQLRKTISGEVYFGAMCRETKRRIAISIDTSGGKRRYSQSGETIGPVITVIRLTGSTTAIYSLFCKSGGNDHLYRSYWRRKVRVRSFASFRSNSQS